MNLITKFRPNSLADVIGHTAIVRSLGTIAKRKDSQQFLFSGPSGVGKTTLSRIMATNLGADLHGIMDIDGARWNGVDDMRAIQDVMQYRVFGGKGKRAIILDECHRLSAQAWDSLLKSIEEPPAHVLWFLCTTNPAKVPKTIKTRCTAFDLKAIDDKQLGELYDEVIQAEKLKIPGDIGDMIIRQANGSPRQLLVNIALCHACKDKSEVAELLRTAEENNAVLDLCRLMAKGGTGSWKSIASLLQKLKDENPESVRIIVCNYFAAAMLNAKTEKDACFFLSILDAFHGEYNQSERMAPLLVSIGRVIFAG